MKEHATFRDYVDDWLAGRVAPPPILQLVGIRLLGYGDHEGTAELLAGPRHHNAMGTVHGGIFCDLADVAIGAAVVSTLKAGESFTTLGLQIDFLRGVVESKLTARARVLKRGAQVAFCECRIEDEAGQHVAQLSSTCLVRQAKG